MVEVNRKDIIITAYSMEEVATPIWSDLFSECGLKFSLKNGGSLLKNSLQSLREKARV